MRLVRFGGPTDWSWGALAGDGQVHELPKHLLPQNGAALTVETIVALRGIQLDTLQKAPTSVELGPPVAGCGKIVCIGLNYRDHAAEAGMEVPKEPVIFMKATSAICGPFGPIRMPPGCTKLDWEVELGVVLGRSGAYIREDQARSYVAGYCIVHDVSERALQLEGTGQWVKGKSADTFAPLGPWLVTPEEVDDPQNLDIWLTVNGQPRQQSSTRNLIYGVDALIAYVSRFMSLHPGDIISTGTPPGVGLGMKPPTYLQEGDVVEMGISGLGRQRQIVTRNAGP